MSSKEINYECMLRWWGGKTLQIDYLLRFFILNGLVGI